MIDTSCPYCGAEAKTGMIAKSFWKCGNATTHENRRSDLCREREAHNQTKSELNSARAKFVAAIDGRDMANEEADKLREQNAKLREIADAFAVALERLDALYRSEQDPDAPMPRPDWLRRPLQMLDAELDRLKEGAK